MVSLCYGHCDTGPRREGGQVVGLRQRETGHSLLSFNGDVRNKKSAHPGQQL